MGCALCVTNVASYCPLVLLAIYDFSFASSDGNTGAACQGSVFVDGGADLFAGLWLFTRVARAFVSMFAFIVGGCPGAMTTSHLSSAQLPFPQVVAAHVSRSQFAICMFGKFDGRSFTRSTSNLHVYMLLIRIGSFQLNQFHDFDIADQALWVSLSFLLSAIGWLSRGGL